MSLSRCQIDPIDVNFHLQNSLKIFDKNSADKIWSKKDKGWKVPSLLPIRVKGPKAIHSTAKEPGWNASKGPFIYYVITFLGFLDPPPPPYVIMFLVLKIIKNWHFLTPFSPYK